MHFGTLKASHGDMFNALIWRLFAFGTFNAYDGDFAFGTVNAYDGDFHPL